MSTSSSEFPDKDFLARISEKNRHIIALAILGILPLILFFNATLGGQKYMGHDTIQWRAGAESIIEHREAYNEEALWATNMFAGMPAYVISVEKSVPHIDNLIRGLTGKIFPAAHYWILLGGLYLFFVLQGFRPLTSCLGSILIGFTTYIPIIIGAGHNSKFIAFVFIPWVLVGYWLMSRTKKTFLSFIVLAMALTLEFRAGHPQVTYYFLYLLFFWWAYDTYRAWEKKTLVEWAGKTGLIALAGTLGVLGNLQQYWRFMEYGTYSIRGGSALDIGQQTGLNLDYAFRWSQGIGELMTLIIPGLFGGSSGEAYWGPKPGTSGPHYLGAIGFILALFGLFYYRKRIKYLFFGVGTLTLLFSLGSHFTLLNELMFRYMPYFDKFRTPEMWLMVTVFCFSVLSVYGIHTFVEQVRNKRIEFKQVAAPLGATLALALLFALGSNALLSFEKPGERQRYAQQLAQRQNVSPDSPQVQQAVSQFINSQLKPRRKEIARSDSIRFFILALAGGGLILAFYYRKIGSGHLLAGLILLSSYDMLSVGQRYLNQDALVPDNLSLAESIEQQRRPADRYIQNNIDNEEGYPYRALPLDANPFNNAVPSYFYPSIGGYTGAKLSYYQDMVDHLLFTGPTGINIEILNMLNVKYITYQRNLDLPGFREVYQGESDQQSSVYENLNVLPKAFFVDSLAFANSPREAVEKMHPESGFDASLYAVVETEKQLTARADTAAEVTVTHYDARNIELEVSRTTDGFLVLSEIYYPPGWSATIDGEETPIYKTNYVLRGLEVPAGEHTVRMEFNPTSYIWGSRIAWASNLLQWSIGIVLLILYGKNRGSEDQKPSESSG